MLWVLYVTYVRSDSAVKPHGGWKAAREQLLLGSCELVPPAITPAPYDASSRDRTSEGMQQDPCSVCCDEQQVCFGPLTVETACMGSYAPVIIVSDVRFEVGGVLLLWSSWFRPIVALSI
jgi:hypothetical protein